MGSSNVFRWANELRDPSGDTILEIVRALKTLNPQAAKAFVACYLGDEGADL